jgi:hypothetical protein
LTKIGDVYGSGSTTGDVKTVSMGTTGFAGSYNLPTEVADASAATTEEADAAAEAQSETEAAARRRQVYLDRNGRKLSTN